MKIKYLVAMNSSHQFFKLHETYATTHPELVSHPYFASKTVPYTEEEFSHPNPATYYFENSERMKKWLDGFIMVAIELDVGFEFI